MEQVVKISANEIPTRGLVSSVCTICRARLRAKSADARCAGCSPLFERALAGLTRGDRIAFGFDDDVRAEVIRRARVLRGAR